MATSEQRNKDGGSAQAAACVDRAHADDCLNAAIYQLVKKIQPRSMQESADGLWRDLPTGSITADRQSEHRDLSGQSSIGKDTRRERVNLGVLNDRDSSISATRPDADATSKQPCRMPSMPNLPYVARSRSSSRPATTSDFKALLPEFAGGSQSDHYS